MLSLRKHSALLSVLSVFISCSRMSPKDNANQEGERENPNQAQFPSAGFSGSGNEKGNGGDVVVCGDRVQMLDYFEARARGVSIDLGAGSTPLEKANFALDRLKRIDIRLATALSNAVATFYDSTAFLDNVQLPDVPDSNLTLITIGCRTEQVAIRGGDRTPGDPGKEYLISKSLFDRMSTTDQAGLILHEVIYKYFYRIYGHQNSKISRYFNGEIASTLLSQIDHAKYNELAKSIGIELTTIQVGTIFCDIDSIERYPSGAVRKCITGHSKTAPEELQSSLLILSISTPISGNGHIVEFYENGMVKSTGDYSLIWDLNLRKQGYQHLYFLPFPAPTNWTLTFGESGQFEKFSEPFYQSRPNVPGFNAKIVSSVNPMQVGDFDGSKNPQYLADYYPGTYYSKAAICRFTCEHPSDRAGDRIYGDQGPCYDDKPANKTCLFAVNGDRMVNLEGEDISASFIISIKYWNFVPASQVALQANGLPKTGTVACKTYAKFADPTTGTDCSYDLVTSSGAVKTFNVGDVLNFDELGRVIEP